MSSFCARVNASSWTIALTDAGSVAAAMVAAPPEYE
jgi:hypothetical protein